MRLIDADALLKKFCVNSEGRRIPEVDCDNHEITVSIKDIKRIIREQPTAYDPVAVVAELEKYKDSHLVERDSERYEHCKEEEINCDGRDCFLCVWDKAISIVRKGGV